MYRRCASSRGFGETIVRPLLLTLAVLWIPGCPQTSAAPPAQDGSQAFATAPAFTAEEIADLVGPIALYPDDLVAIVLPASTYPLQIVQAQRFLEAAANDSSLQPDEAWDDSVVALLNYPQVVKRMSDDLDWTQALGEAVLGQQPEVIAAIEAFRNRAHTAGNLKSDDRQVVETGADAIRIRPADPQVIYVPYYEPSTVTVYNSAPVYRYYPYAYPVYYYPYPTDYVFASRFFWGVTTFYTLGWESHRVHTYYSDYHDHPFYGRQYHYNRHYYRRPTRFVNDYHFHDRDRERDGYRRDDDRGHYAGDGRRPPSGNRPHQRDNGTVRRPHQQADTYWLPDYRRTGARPGNDPRHARQERGERGERGEREERGERGPRQASNDPQGGELAAADPVPGPAPVAIPPPAIPPPAIPPVADRPVADSPANDSLPGAALPAQPEVPQPRYPQGQPQPGTVAGEPPGRSDGTAPVGEADARPAPAPVFGTRSTPPGRPNGESGRGQPRALPDAQSLDVLRQEIPGQPALGQPRAGPRQRNLEGYGRSEPVLAPPRARDAPPARPLPAIREPGVQQPEPPVRDIEQRAREPSPRRVEPRPRGPEPRMQQPEQSQPVYAEQRREQSRGQVREPVGEPVREPVRIDPRAGDALRGSRIQQGFTRPVRSESRPEHGFPQPEQRRSDEPRAAADSNRSRPEFRQDDGIHRSNGNGRGNGGQRNRGGAGPGDIAVGNEGNGSPMQR